jgi:hypothetical protein
MSVLEKEAKVDTAPCCVYCDKPMRRVLTESINGRVVLMQFACDGCGWEVTAPHK